MRHINTGTAGFSKSSHDLHSDVARGPRSHSFSEVER